MVTYKSIEDFYKGKGIPTNIEDILSKRKDRTFINKMRLQLKKHETLLSLIPKQKLEKVIAAKYKREKLKGIERKVKDVETLRKLKKEKIESERTIKLFENVLRQYSVRLKKIIDDYNKYKNELEKETKKVNKHRREYESLVKTYDRLLLRWKYKIKIKDEFAFYEMLKGTKKAISRERDKYLSAVNKVKKLQRKLVETENAYKNLLSKVKKAWEKI